MLPWQTYIPPLMSWPIAYRIVWLYSGVTQYNIPAVVKCIDFGWINLKFLYSYGSHPKFKHKGSSVQFSHSVMSNSLWPHGLQYSRPPCPSPTPRVYSNSCPLCQWCNPAISSSIVPFSSHLQSFPSSGSFQMSQFFTSVGQSIGVSASTSILPMNIQDWFPLRWTG